MKISRKKDQNITEKEKVDQRREEVLATGRKFKYPLQWTKHRIVINTILISVVVIALIVTGIWLGLYKLNMTNDLLFRITEVVPVSVAKVDEKEVRFSDYLLFYRSSINSVERQTTNQIDENSLPQLRLDYQRSALKEVEKYTYALSLAENLNIEVTDEEVAKEFSRHLNIGGVERSEEGFIKIIEDNFGLNKSEYERMLYLTLVKSKVEIASDETANKIVQKVEKILSSNDNDYQKVAEELGEQIVYEETGGLVDNKNIDGGRANEAMKLEPGKSSGKFISTNGDGYYFVKLINKTDTSVNFVSIKVPFSKFDEDFNKLEESGKITEYITIPGQEE